MRIARIITIVAIVLAVLLWFSTILGWLMAEPGFEPINVLVSAILSSLVAVLGWLRTRSKPTDGELPKTSSLGRLEITNVGFTHNAEIDVKVRNLDDDAIIINRITIQVIKDTGLIVMPALQPTAHYTVPIDDLKKGESRSLDVSHFIDGHKADRFLVALNTTRVLKIRMTLHCNKDDIVSFDKTIWMWEDD